MFPSHCCLANCPFSTPGGKDLCGVARTWTRFARKRAFVFRWTTTLQYLNDLFLQIRVLYQSWKPLEIVFKLPNAEPLSYHRASKNLTYQIVKYNVIKIFWFLGSGTQLMKDDWPDKRQTKRLKLTTILAVNEATKQLPLDKYKLLHIVSELTETYTKRSEFCCKSYFDKIDRASSDSCYVLPGKWIKDKL